MMDLVRGNFALKLLSAFIAAFLWYGANRSGEVTRQYRVDVLVTSVEGDVVLMDEPEDINLIVKGSSGAIGRIDEEQIRALEIGPIGPETTRWVVRDEDFSLPSGVEIQSYVPSTLQLNLEPLVERELPVSANIRGQVSGGFEFVDARVEPQTVRVQMPESYLGELETLHTEVIDLTGVVATFSREVRLLQHRRFVRFVDDPEVTVRVEVAAVEEVRVFETVPVVLTGPDASRCSTSSSNLRVTVTGPRTQVEALDTRQIFASIACSEWTAKGPGVHVVTPQIENVPVSLESTWSPRTLRVTVEAPPVTPETPEDGVEPEATEP